MGRRTRLTGGILLGRQQGAAVDETEAEEDVLEQHGLLGGKEEQRDIHEAEDGQETVRGQLILEGEECKGEEGGPTDVTRARVWTPKMARSREPTDNMSL